MSFLAKCTILRGEKFRPVFKNIGEMICMFEDAMHLLLSAIATVSAGCISLQGYEFEGTSCGY